MLGLSVLKPSTLLPALRLPHSFQRDEPFGEIPLDQRRLALLQPAETAAARRFQADDIPAHEAPVGGARGQRALALGGNTGRD